MMLRRTLLPVLLASSLSVSASGPAPPRSADVPLYPPFGLDLGAANPGVQPGDDFFEYCDGAWLARTDIPPDKPYMTEAQALRDRTEAQLRELIESAAAHAGHAPTDPAGKVGVYYRAFMDEERIEALGGKPIAAELAAIRASRTHADVASLMGHSVDDFTGSVVQVGVDFDLKDPGHYAVYLTQAGLTMPDRNYYLKPQFAREKAALGVYAETLLGLIGWPDARSRAAEIVAFETRIAEVSWTKEEQRDLAKLYNPFTPEDLGHYAPGVGWQQLLAGAGLSAKRRVIVGEKTAFPKIADIYSHTPLHTLQAWLAFTTADSAAPYLSRDFVQARFEFRDKALQGVRELPPRWKRGVKAVAGGDCPVGQGACFGTLNWAVGQLYSARYFPPTTKAKIESMVVELMQAFRHRIERLEWMGEKTRAEALRKLDTYVVKVGYPDHWRDYSGVLVREEEAVGNVRRAARADWNFYLRRSDGPVDKSDWVMTPQTVDAYNGVLRDIVFPAAILQAPYFDAAADPAVNYGGIGATIGHELTHGFDDQGRMLDASGALRDWWTEGDAKEFTARAAVLGAQYGTYEPTPGVHIRPDLTMGENIADLGGLLIAYDAYQASLHGVEAPVLETLTGDQRFFRAFAQSWRGKAREDFIRQLTTSDPHSWRKFRVNGVVRNIDPWYGAFAVTAGQALFLNTQERARIW
jgi:putative endopeptidase